MRILVVQRSLAPPGGGNAVAAWMIHALVCDHQVSTITADRWSESETNAYYGTSIPHGVVTQHIVPPPWRWLAGMREDRLTRLRWCSLLRHARPLSHGFDVLISADNFAVFEKTGLQYVHFPAQLQPPPEKWAPLVNMYFAACNALLGAAWSDAKRNVTLANSEWTADGLRRIGEVREPLVLYPPVLDPGEGLPWEQRDNAFLCVGRFHGSKRIETAISIFEQVRWPDARLIIVGSAVDGAYTKRIRDRASRTAGIEIREDLSRAELNALMGRSRYGIQAMEGEHFGMATAEMTRAGCLVFAHNSGGSPEVLNNEEALLWTTVPEAVEKIRQIDSAAVRRRLRDHARQFSTEHFVERFRQIVATSVAGSPDR